MNKKYDAFLSHNSKDKLTVEEIGRRLKEKGKVKLWIDKWNLIPGDPWEKEIENALDESKCCVLFLGPNGIGTYQNKEMESTLKRKVSTEDIRIIPVLLPGANRPEMESKLPSFLREVTWVIFRFNLDEPDAFDALVCGIKKIKPEKRSKDKTSTTIPFMGLRNFREEDTSFFFGRDYEIQQLMNKLRNSRFLAVLGPSGSGKSSLVQAGLIPHLRENSLVCMMTPRERPFEELATALCCFDQENNQFTIEELSSHLKESQDNLYNTAIEILKHQNKKYFYIIIDQFEELFTQTKTEEERREFIYILLNLLDVHDGPVNIIIAIRSDFLGKCVYYSELNIYIMDHLFQVGPIKEDKLVDVIEIPARTVGIYFEKGLVVKILKDIKGVTIELPLLAHALLELYNRKVENILTLKAYEEIGGIEGSLVKSAEEEYQKLDEIEKEILRKMFTLHLIQPGEGTKDTRRKITEAELLKIGSDPGVVQDLIDKWINKRFLTKSFDTYRKQNFVEIAHEAIINKWNKITSWMAEDREAARRMGILRLEALKWQNSGRKQEYLFQGARIIEMEELIKNYYEDIDQISAEFLESSIMLRNQQEQERKTRQKRKLLIVSGFAFIIFLALLISLFFLDSINKKDNYIRGTTTLTFADTSSQMMKKNQVLNSFQILADAVNINPDRKFDKTLLLSMNRYWYSPLLTNIFQHTLPIRGAIFYSDGTKILTWGNDKKAILWDIKSGDQLCEIKTEYPIYRALLSPDNEKILIYFNDRDEIDKKQLVLDVLDVATLKKNVELFKHEGFIFGAKFSKDGRKILSWSFDFTIRIWDLQTGKELKIFKHEDKVASAVFNNDETQILSCSYDKTVRLWDVNNGNECGIPFKSDGPIVGVMFNTKETKILAWALNNKAIVWDVKTRKKMILEHTAQVNGAIFNRSETKILTWSKDKTAIIWNAITGEEEHILKHDGPVNGAVFDKMEKKVLTFSDDNTAILWDANSGKLILKMSHEGPIVKAILNKDETILLTCSRDNTARLWDMNTGEQIGFELRHNSPLMDAWFNNDETKILTCSSDSVRVWNAFLLKQKEQILNNNGCVIGAEFNAQMTKVLSWTDKKTARVWDAKTSEQIGKELKHDGDIFGAKFDPGGTMVLTSIDARTAQIWDVDTGKPIMKFPHQASVIDAIFDPKGEKILTWTDDNIVCIWDVKTGKSIGILKHEERIKGAVFNADGTLVLTWSKDKTAKIWDANTCRLKVFPLKHERFVFGARFSPPDEKSILTWSSDNQALLWDANSGRQVLALPHANRVVDATFSADGKKILSRVLNWIGEKPQGIVYIWDNIASGNPISKPKIIPNDTNVIILGARFNSDGKRVLTWSDDNTARLWDISAAPPQQIGDPFEHDGAVLNALFNSEETWIFTWSADNAIQIWDIKTGKSIGLPFRFIDRLNGVKFIPGENKILTWSDDGTARIWDIGLDLDFPKDKIIMQVIAVTGTARDPETGKISVKNSEEWEKINKEYMKFAQKHFETCKYRRSNIWKVLYQEKAHPID